MTPIDPELAVIYEVRLRVERAISTAFDAWLDEHIEEMLEIDGFESVQLIRPEPGDDETRVRIVRYRVASRDHLQRYLTEHAARMRNKGLERFGDRFSASREIYPANATPADDAVEHYCQNCTAPLRGQYCAVCGQRNKHRIISLWELLREIVGDLADLDSRVWRTLFALIFRPGALTVAYLRGKRVRYTPPFRLYLVTSLAFFVVAFFGADQSGFSFGDIVFDGEEPLVESADPAADADVVTAAPGYNDALATGRQTPPQRAAGQPDGETATAIPAPPPAAGSVSAKEKCDQLEVGSGATAAMLQKRVRRACERLTADGGAQRFFEGLVDNLPTAMFFFLPLIALAMTFLYPLSRRYYVEHLLFVLHFHAFFFALFTATTLIARLPAALPGHGVINGTAAFAAVVYTPVYLYRAMRRVYGQGAAATAAKFVMLSAAYLFSLVLLGVAVLLFTALSL